MAVSAAPYDASRSVTMASVLAVATERFSQEFQRCGLVTTLHDVAFEHFAFVIHRSPEVVPSAIDLHEHLVGVPVSMPVRARIESTRPRRISATKCCPNRPHQILTVHA